MCPLLLYISVKFLKKHGVMIIGSCYDGEQSPFFKHNFTPRPNEELLIKTTLAAFWYNANQRLITLH